jgi:hypothetical protein
MTGDSGQLRNRAGAIPLGDPGIAVPSFIGPEGMTTYTDTYLFENGACFGRSSPRPVSSMSLRSQIDPGSNCAGVG